MKRKIYKRYRTRKKGGQHYHIGRKNYGSKLFKQQIEQRLDISGTPSQKRMILRSLEKAPELVKPLEGTPIKVIKGKPQTARRELFSRKLKKIEAPGENPEASYNTYMTKEGLIKDEIELRDTAIQPSEVEVKGLFGTSKTVIDPYPISRLLKHELVHKKQQGEDRLISYDTMVAHGIEASKNPYEMEASAVERQPLQRRMPLSIEKHTGGMKAFRRMFE